MFLECERNSKIWSLKDTISSERESGYPDFTRGQRESLLQLLWKSCWNVIVSVLSVSKVTHLYNLALFPQRSHSGKTEG